MIKYRASTDLSVKVITAGVFLLFGFISYTIIEELRNSPGNETMPALKMAVMLMLPAILLVCWLYSPAYYSINNNELIIHRPGPNRRISINTIESVHSVSKEEMNGTIRSFAVGGLFGYFGRFMVPKFGSVNVYATRMSNLILVRTRDGEKILLSPDDIELAGRIESFIS
jgi:hypothetical protein